MQRLDGPVRGNGKIIQELESVFRGAGWRVIKVIWGGKWDSLLANDHTGVLKQHMEEVVDGEYQLYEARTPEFTRKHFFNKYPELEEMANALSDEDISHLNRGGDDPMKVYAAFSEAMKTKGQPTVVLVKTVKGYGLSTQTQAVNKSHQIKKLDQALMYFRDRFDLPFTDEQLETLPFFRPEEGSAEMKYLKGRREALGGHLPNRRSGHIPLNIPELSIFNQSLLKGSNGKEQSTTMMFVRLLSAMLKNKDISR